MHWYLRVLKNYLTFSGRAHRTEFWMFTLISVIISVALSVIDHLSGTAPAPIHPHSTGFDRARAADRDVAGFAIGGVGI